MRAFAELLDRLYFSHGNLAKAAILHDYLRRTPDPDRGWAVAAIAGELRFDLFKRTLVRDLVAERTDPVLFAMSYDYVGEMSETVAHLWPSIPHDHRPAGLPPLHEVIEAFRGGTKPEIRELLAGLLDISTPAQRWALLKLGTQTLRVGHFGAVHEAHSRRIWRGRPRRSGGGLARAAASL